jgi:hypothetical protein
MSDECEATPKAELERQIMDPNVPKNELEWWAAAEIERLQEALEGIDQWSRAYPLSVFPEPDLKKAAEVLKASGMTLDAISAHAMRHVVEGVGKIARAALAGRIEPGGGAPDNSEASRGGRD